MGAEMLRYVLFLPRLEENKKGKMKIAVDKLTHYRECVQRLIQEYAQVCHLDTTEEVEVILDKERDHYLLLELNWEDDKYHYYPIFHLDLKKGKIWIQQNNTERRIAHELVEMGVPKEDIVLGFQSPYRRQFTEFAAG